MEDRAIVDREVHEARERFRTEMARYAKRVAQLADPDEDLSDVAPHLLGRR